MGVLTISPLHTRGEVVKMTKAPLMTSLTLPHLAALTPAGVGVKIVDEYVVGPQMFLPALEYRQTHAEFSGAECCVHDVVECPCTVESPRRAPPDDGPLSRKSSMAGPTERCTAERRFGFRP
jgi:hypothetical protein